MIFFVPLWILVRHTWEASSAMPQGIFYAREILVTLAT